MEFIERINDTIEREELYDAYSALVVMVSGGADSTAMLRAFASGQLASFGALEVLHVNHQLRADEADADERFVSDLCAELDVSCHVARLDVAGFAEERQLNVEDAGRTLRYEAARRRLKDLCLEHGLPHGKGIYYDAQGNGFSAVFNHGYPNTISYLGAEGEAPHE
jgi:tRNA(Ile)-lysidine synthase